MSAPNTAPNDCPEAPGFRESLATLILHEACQTAGGIAPLAKLLGVSSAALNRWLDGEEAAPVEIYQACIGIVLLHERQEK
jgi:predicted transcriptional regulator